LPLYIDTRSEPTAAVAICDRCKFKFPIARLVSDPNSPGLRVCEDTCKDIFDPYRLPPRVTEKIDVRYPRPEEPLDGAPVDWTTEKTGSYK
jgi:hypothetical protein